MAPPAFLTAAHAPVRSDQSEAAVFGGHSPLGVKPRPSSHSPSGRHDGGGDPAAAAAAAARPEDSKISGSRVGLRSPPRAGPGREGSGERWRAASSTLAPRNFGIPPGFWGAAIGGAGAGRGHARGNDPEPSGIAAPAPGAALVGRHRRRHGGRPDPAAAPGAARSARGRPALPAPPAAPAPLPPPGRGSPRRRPQPGGHGVLGIGVVPAAPRRESAPGFPGAPRADPPVRVVLPGPAGDGGGAGAGAAPGGPGLVPRFGRSRSFVCAAPARHGLHLPRARAGGGDGRGRAGGGACPSNPEAPPPFLPALHPPFSHGRVHLLADVERLQPIADGAAASPRPPRPPGRGSAPGPAPGPAHRPRPRRERRDPEGAAERVARGPGHARGRAAPLAPQEPPAVGGQRPVAPNLLPKSAELAWARPGRALRDPEKTLEGLAGMREEGRGEPQEIKKRPPSY